ncbi:MAG: dynamin family protein, partial [Myxococcales bacterium]|nr:dynamin family protein [Myxococcales bacterium]
MTDQLSAYQRKRHELAELVGEGGRTAEGLHHWEISRALHREAGDIRNRSFNVVVVGEFSSGKSTLLNALLGEAILPAKMAPCTKSILEIQYAETPTLHVYRSGVELPEVRPLAYLKEVGVIQAQEVDDARREIAESKIDRLVVRVPNSPCDVGVDLLDTPGLNEASERTTITTQRLPRADASVLVLRATDLLSKSERDFIEDEAKKDPVNRRWLDNAFVVVTFADVAAQDDEAELDALKDRLDEFLDGVLQPMGIAPGRRYFVDARSALKLRTGASATTDGMEFGCFEEHLRTFLAEHRGRIEFQGKKLTAIAAIERATDSLKADLERQAREGKALQEAAQKARATVEQERKRMDRVAADLTGKAPRLARDIVNDFRANAGHWVNTDLVAYMATQRYPDALVARTKPASEWYVAKATSWLEATIQTWSSQKPPEYLREMMDDFARANQGDLEALRANLQTSAHELGLTQFDQGDVADESPLDWLTRGAAGWLAGGPLGAAVGGLLGWKGILTNLGVNLAIASVAAIAGVVIPVVGAILVAAVVAIAQIAIGQDSAKDRIRDRVVEGLQKGLPRELEKATRGIETSAVGIVEGVAQELCKAAEAVLAVISEAATNAEETSRASQAQRELRAAQLRAGVRSLEAVAAAVTQLEA